MEQDSKVDPDRTRADMPFDRAEGFSGQDYRSEDERALGREMPAGQVPSPDAAPNAGPPAAADTQNDLPPDNGRRAAVDATTGAVLGSGVGTGGGQPGEDMDADNAAGDGPVITGRGSRDA